MNVVQDTARDGTLATLYFDRKVGPTHAAPALRGVASGWRPNAGRYADYHAVAGVTVPFRWTVTWLDGRESVELTDVKVNVPVDDSVFTQPSPDNRR